MDWTDTENLQPLATGRTFKSEPAVDVLSKNSLVEADEQRAQLLQQIESYSGDDPLVLWISLIRHVTQAYKTDSKSQLIPLLERCMRELKDSAQYKDDIRYLRIWIQYAANLQDPTDVFTYLEDNGIGHTHALLYETHAAFLERSHAHLKARSVYQLGIARFAAPLDRLRFKYDEFEYRMVQREERRVRGATPAAPVYAGPTDENGAPALRQPFAVLSTQQTRTVTRPPGPLSRSSRGTMAGIKRSAPASNDSVDVFVDEEFGGEDTGEIYEAPRSGLYTLTSVEAGRRENSPRKLPLGSRKFRIPQRRGVAPQPEPALDIPMDEDLVDMASPEKAAATQVSVRRHLDTGTSLQSALEGGPLPVHTAHPAAAAAPTTRPTPNAPPLPASTLPARTMPALVYDPNVLVGQGGQEVCFEELRAEHMRRLATPLTAASPDRFAATAALHQSAKHDMQPSTQSDPPLRPPACTEVPMSALKQAPLATATKHSLKSGNEQNSDHEASKSQDGAIEHGYQNHTSRNYEAVESQGLHPDGDSQLHEKSLTKQSDDSSVQQPAAVMQSVEAGQKLDASMPTSSQEPVPHPTTLDPDSDAENQAPGEGVGTRPAVRSGGPVRTGLTVRSVAAPTTPGSAERQDRITDAETPSSMPRSPGRTGDETTSFDLFGNAFAGSFPEALPGALEPTVTVNTLEAYSQMNDMFQTSLPGTVPHQVKPAVALPPRPPGNRRNLGSTARLGRRSSVLPPYATQPLPALHEMAQAEGHNNFTTSLGPMLSGLQAVGDVTDAPEEHSKPNNDDLGLVYEDTEFLPSLAAASRTLGIQAEEDELVVREDTQFLQPDSAAESRSQAVDLPPSRATRALFSPTAAQPEAGSADSAAAPCADVPQFDPDEEMPFDNKENIPPPAHQGPAMCTEPSLPMSRALLPSSPSRCLVIGDGHSDEDDTADAVDPSVTLAQAGSDLQDEFEVYCDIAQ